MILSSNNSGPSHGIAVLTVDEGLEVRYGIAVSIDMDLSTERSA